MRTSDFDYPLPSELIAQTPLETRDASRLLVLDRASGKLTHRRFHEILDYLRPGDLMVFNQSRVMPARLHGRRAGSEGKVELLLLRRMSPGVWEALAKPGRRLRPGDRIVLQAVDEASAGEGKSPQSPLYESGGDSITPPTEQGNATYAPLLAKGGIQGGSPSSKEANGESTAHILASGLDGIKTVQLDNEEAIARLGQMPLPPYIHHRLKDPERYQTVYARQPGSAAAPTAGLHFTQPLLDRLKEAGVEQTFVTLHVGLDTFRPVQDEDPTQHRIHTEYFEIGQDTADALNHARQDGRRIVAVGTTSVRVLEYLALLMEQSRETLVQPISGDTGIFILPGHRFRLVDALITNFHLPRSTLLMLASAFAGRRQILDAYQEAIREQYRFYSFGDAMFIL